jgi:ABC-2 type transport system ATP-binding protein
VFLSSHLMSEMALTAEHLIVVGRGRMIRDMSVDDFIASASRNSVFVRSPDYPRLRDLLLEDGIEVSSSVPGHLEVTGVTSDEIGYRASNHGVTLLELSPVHVSLEEAFMALTHDAVEYRSARSPADSRHLSDHFSDSAEASYAPERIAG